jgi:hypothetical protein
MILRIMFFRWALVDDKPKILLDTLHATNRDIYPVIYSIISVLLTLLSNKRDIFMWANKVINNHIQVDFHMSVYKLDLK